MMRLFAFTLLPAALAWGPDGHMITGQIASLVLSSQENEQLSKILGGKGLADVATWADIVKHTSPWFWTAELHFINVPDKECTFNWDRDCKDSHGKKGNCVAGAIINYTQQFEKKGPGVLAARSSCNGLHKEDCVKDGDCEWRWTGSWTTSCKDRSGPSPSPGGESRDIALKFLVHYMGDIHQPLHVSWTTDKGGNSISVEEGFDNDKKKNLHQVWDDGIIVKAEENAGFKWPGYAAKLAKQVKEGTWKSEAEKWASCLSASSFDLKSCLSEMAEESIEAACASAYKDDHGKMVQNEEELDETYFTTREAVIEKRLAQGGVRLAALLRHALKETAAEEATIIV